MHTGSPCVRKDDRASRSEDAFDAEYGEFGSSGWVSGHEPDSIDPYTLSVDTCTNFETPASTAPCNKVCVPTTLVITKSAAPMIERSTCDSAAKCTTRSTPAMTCETVFGSQMSPWTNRSRCSSFTDARLASLPA